MTTLSWACTAYLSSIAERGGSVSMERSIDIQKGVQTWVAGKLYNDGCITLKDGRVHITGKGLLLLGLTKQEVNA